MNNPFSKGNLKGFVCSAYERGWNDYEDLFNMANKNNELKNKAMDLLKKEYLASLEILINMYAEEG